MSTIVLSALAPHAKELAFAPLSTQLAMHDEVLRWVDLESIEFGTCVGCSGCSKTGRCVQNDSMTELVDDLQGCDRLVLATPIVLGVHHPLMKRAVDRFLPLAGQAFTVRDQEMHHQSRMPNPFSIIGVGWLDASVSKQEARTFEQLIARHAVNLNCPSYAAVLAGPDQNLRTTIEAALSRTERAT